MGRPFRSHDGCWGSAAGANRRGLPTGISLTLRPGVAQGGRVGVPAGAAGGFGGPVFHLERGALVGVLAGGRRGWCRRGAGTGRASRRRSRGGGRSSVSQGRCVAGRAPARCSQFMPVGMPAGCGGEQRGQREKHVPLLQAGRVGPPPPAGSPSSAGGWAAGNGQEARSRGARAEKPSPGVGVSPR